VNRLVFPPGGWLPLTTIGLSCEGKYIRTKYPLTVSPHEGGSCTLPGGAIGLCYAASSGGVIHVAFMGDFRAPPKDASSFAIVRMPLHCAFDARDIVSLQINVET
jgi:hypothetical protein